MSTSRSPKQKSRARAGSIQAAIENIESDPAHHLAGAFGPGTPNDTPPPSRMNVTAPDPKPATGRSAGSVTPSASVVSLGLWSDLKTMRWMTVPASSLKMLVIPLILWANWQILSPKVPNPFAKVIFISGQLPDTTTSRPEYQKTYYDLVFIAYYVIVFSFIRQTFMIHISRPLTRALGITHESKMDRFGEQGYAMLYFTVSGCYGVYVMSQLPTWWFRTEHYWLQYPHWRMIAPVKSYYLLQSAYWLQQLLVLALGLEKPRKDFVELIVHHIVTLWLIGWSYLINLTYIGNSVFVTMDVSDIFLAFAKICHYLKLENTSAVAFGWFVCVWTYLRHWLNLRMLWSVWTEFDLIPEETRQWDTARGVWLTWWMKYQILAPMFILQIVNLFWYFLIWRILLRAIFHSNLSDERSDDEEEQEQVASTTGKAKAE